MEKLFFAVFTFLSIFIQVRGQDTCRQDSVYVAAEQMPHFPGGETNMMRYISDSLRISKDIYLSAIDPSSYRESAVISFVVTKTGKLKDIKMERSTNISQIDSIYVDMMKKMPDWIPGSQNGRKVNVRYSLPIRIRIRFGE